MEPSSHIANIRKGLNNAFDAPQLAAFCLDYFPDVYDCFDSGMRKDEKITLLLASCRRHPTGFELLYQIIQKNLQLNSNQGDVLSPLIKQLEAYLRHSATNQSARQSPETKLHNALLNMNYHKQTILFRRAHRQRASAFLIHGPMMFGQRWLLNRLVATVLQDGGRQFSFHCQRRIRRVGLEALWAEVYRQMRLEGKLSASRVIDKVFQLWQTQNVVIIFYDIYSIPEAHLQKFIKTFWFGLRQKGFPDGSFKLFMFLVDDSEEVNHWNLPFDEAVAVTTKPYPIVKLPILSAFDESDLTQWATYHDNAPLELTDPQKALQIIHEGENGTPELVMQHICEHILEYDWYNGVERCLAY